MMTVFIFATLGCLIAIVLNYLADLYSQYSHFLEDNQNESEERKFSYKPACRKCGYEFSIRNYLFSFRCPQCGAKPGLRYWLVWIISIAGGVAVSLFPLFPLSAWTSLGLLFFLGLVFLIDVENKEVLNITSYLGIVLCLILGVSIHSWQETLLGGVAGAAVMGILFFGGKLFRKIIISKRQVEVGEALGLGDVYVCGYLGLLVGWPHVIGMLIIAVLLGGIFALGYMIINLITKKYQAFTAIPYVPFLILAALFLFYIPG